MFDWIINNPQAWWNLEGTEKIIRGQGVIIILLVGIFIFLAVIGCWLDHKLSGFKGV